MYPQIYSTLRLLNNSGRETRRCLDELERSQWLSRTELKATQLKKLKHLVQYAYEHVPFYRDKYRIAGIHPNDINSYEDFQKLPYLTRDDINKNLDTLISQEYIDKVQLGSTGGSTGKPMRFFIDESFWWWNSALELRGRSWYGVREGDKMAWVWGAPHEMSGWNYRRRLVNRIKRHRYLNSFSMSESNMQEFVSMLVRWQPAMFRGSVSALSLFAKFISERRINGICPRLVETTAEILTDEKRQLLEAVFQCPVVNCYSARELATIAYQCADGWLHVSETRYLETVADDNNVSPGEIGEVVITSLTQFAMPILRYKIDDLAILETNNCSCGRELPVLREVVGKTQDILVTLDNRLIYGSFFSKLFRVRPEVFRFQVYQPDRQHLEVRLVCNQDVTSDWLDDIRVEIQKQFGLAMQISLQIVDHIELTQAGKHRFVVSNITPNFLE